MWITDDLPRLQRSRFAKCKPFHCVIRLNAADGEIYKLVRTSEGPLHNGLDESCEFVGSEEFVGLKNVKIDSGFADERLLISEKGRTLAVRLGPLDPQRTIRIEFNYELPQGIDLPDDAPVVLKAQLIRRSPGF